jgi:hypothetical protein
MGLSEDKVTRNRWETLPHPPYTPDLAPPDRRLFGPVTKQISGRHFTSEEEVHRAVRSWLMVLDTDFLCSGTGNAVKRCDRCLNEYGDRVEEQLIYTRFLRCIFTLF